MPGVSPLPRRRELETRQLRRPDGFALDDFHIAEFQEELADLGKIGGIIVTFAHAPEIVLP